MFLPLGTYTKAMRRGIPPLPVTGGGARGSADLADADPGSMASSSGKLIIAPTPRRTARRDSRRFFVMRTSLSEPPFGQVPPSRNAVQLEWFNPGERQRLR